MERKVTFRLDMDYEYHRLILEKIEARDKSKYKTITDYICKAVSAFEGESAGTTLTEEDRRLIREDISALITQHFVPEHQPGY